MEVICANYSHDSDFFIFFRVTKEVKEFFCGQKIFKTIISKKNLGIPIDYNTVMCHHNVHCQKQCIFRHSKLVFAGNQLFCCVLHFKK